VSLRASYAQFFYTLFHIITANFLANALAAVALFKDFSMFKIQSLAQKVKSFYGRGL
jgi:hypothetical protein